MFGPWRIMVGAKPNFFEIYTLTLKPTSYNFIICDSIEQQLLRSYSYPNIAITFRNIQLMCIGAV